MKYRILVIALISSLCSLRAQTGPSIDLANKIADKMRDSLGLSQREREAIFTTNLHLFNQKKAVWQQFQNKDSITRHLQLIENTRDSLYHEILASDKYEQYKRRKRNLVNNN